MYSPISILRNFALSSFLVQRKDVNSVPFTGQIKQSVELIPPEKIAYWSSALSGTIVSPKKTNFVCNGAVSNHNWVIRESNHTAQPRRSCSFRPGFYLRAVMSQNSLRLKKLLGVWYEWCVMGSSGKMNKCILAVFFWVGRGEGGTEALVKKCFTNNVPSTASAIPTPPWSQRSIIGGQGPFKRLQHLPNIRSTKAERMFGKCWTNGVFKRFQRHSTFSRTEKMLNRCWMKV